MDFCCAGVPPEPGQLYLRGEGRLQSSVEGQHPVSSVQINGFLPWLLGEWWPLVLILSPQQWTTLKRCVRFWMMITELQFPSLWKFVCSHRMPSVLTWEISASLTYMSVKHAQSVVISIQRSTALNERAWKITLLQFNDISFSETNKKTPHSCSCMV